jgi:ADP-ribosylglycohydrolase
MESGNRFTHRHPWAIAAGAAVAAVVLLVVLYRATTPRSAQTTTASGDRIPESEVLQVGALPVT